MHSDSKGRPKQQLFSLPPLLAGVGINVLIFLLIWYISDVKVVKAIALAFCFWSIFCWIEFRFHSFVRSHIASVSMRVEGLGENIL